MEKSTLIAAGNSKFKENAVRDFSGGINSDDSILNFTGLNTFRGNSAEYGAGISVYNGILIYTGNSTFRDNSAWQSGGGIQT